MTDGVGARNRATTTTTTTKDCIGSSLGRNGLAALDEVLASAVEDIRYYDTPLYCHLVGTDAAEQLYYALSFSKQALPSPVPSRNKAGEDPGGVPYGDSASTGPFEPTAATPLAPVASDGLVYRTTQYSPAEALSLMETLAEQPGVRTGRLRAILGCVRFLEGYYIIGLTRRRLVARIGAHRIFAAGDVQLLPLTIDPQRLQRLYEETARTNAAAAAATAAPSAPFSMSVAASYVASVVAASSGVLYSRRSQEERYKERFLSQHANRTFYYSHTYDLTHTLQTNMTTAKEAATAHTESEGSGGDEDHGSGTGISDSQASGRSEARQRRMKYVWNEYFLEPFAADGDANADDVDADTDGHFGDAEEETEDRDEEWMEGSSDSDTSDSTRSGERYSGASSRTQTRRRSSDDFADTPDIHFSSAQFADVWAVYMIRGSIVQRQVRAVPSQRRLLVTLIARISKESAGTRYLRRGVSSDGRVANHVEVEQILCDEDSLTHHFTQGTFSSYVQVRGSVPLRWYHPPNASMPKPAVVVAEADPFHNASCKHFQELLADYGAPLVAMDFLKMSDSRRREAALGDAYRSIVSALRRSVEDHHVTHGGAGGETPDDVLRYRALDLRDVADRAWNAVTAIAERDSADISHFSCRAGGGGSIVSLQRGVVRSNCVDCIDRTNIGQFFFSLHALGAQLASMQFIGRPSDAVLSHGLAETLLSMFLVVGDALATQYGGSAQVGAGVLHRGRGWDQVMGLKRLYANVMNDTRKQFVLNLYLGRFQPNPRHLVSSGAGVMGGSGRHGSRMCNRHMRVITGKAAGRREGSRVTPLSSAMPSHAALDTQLDERVADSEENSSSPPRQPSMETGSAIADILDTDGASSATGSLASVPLSARPMATRSDVRRSFVDRLRGVKRLNPFAPPSAPARQGERRAAAVGAKEGGSLAQPNMAGGEAEPDYYLQVKRGPQLPSVSLLRTWWIAPLAHRQRQLSRTARWWHRDCTRADSGDVSRADTTASWLAWRERALAIDPPREDAPAGSYTAAAATAAAAATTTDETGDGEKAFLSDGGRAKSAGMVPTLFETPCFHEAVVGSISGTREHDEELLATECGAMPVGSEGTAGRVSEAPTRQGEFIHSHSALPAVVKGSVYARQLAQLDALSDASADDHSCPGGMSEQEARLLVGSTVNLLGAPERWSADDFAEALRWCEPTMVGRSTLDAIRVANFAGFAAGVGSGELPPPLLELPSSQQVLVMRFAASVSAFVQLADANAHTHHHHHHHAGRPAASNLDGTLRILQQYFGSGLTSENAAGVVRDWKVEELLHPLYGVEQGRSYYRFLDQFPSAHGGADQSQMASQPAGTPPVPFAVAATNAFSALDLFTWLTCRSRSQRDDVASRFSLCAFDSPAERARAAWDFAWWLVVAGIVKPVVRPAGMAPTSNADRGVPFPPLSGLQVWELLSDPTALFRVDGGAAKGSGEYASTASALNHPLSSSALPFSSRIRIDSPAALAESLCSAALSTLAAVLRVPQDDPLAFSELCHSLAGVLAESAAVLRCISVASLEEKELLPFWVNLYNALYVHTWLIASVPPCASDLLKCVTIRDEASLTFLKGHGYVIGPSTYCFTLYDIKYGILCGNQPPSSEFLPPFSPRLYQETLHKLTPPGLREGTVLPQETIADSLLVAELQRRARVADVTQSSPSPPAKLKNALTATSSFLQWDQRRFLLQRTLLALLDAYLPLPLPSSGALLPPPPVGSSARAASEAEANSTSSAGAVPQRLPERTYKQTIAAVMEHYSSRRQVLRTDGTLSTATESPLDIMRVYGFRVACGRDTGAGGRMPAQVGRALTIPSYPHSIPASPSSFGVATTPAPPGTSPSAVPPTHRASSVSGRPPSPCSTKEAGWVSVDASACLYATSLLQRARVLAMGQHGAAAPPPLPPPPLPPRRLRLLSYLRVGGEKANPENGTRGRSPVSVPHLCDPLLVENWEEHLLRIERSFLQTVLSAPRASQTPALMAHLLAGQPDSLPLGDTTAQALRRLQQSQRAGACAAQARGLWRDLGRATDFADWQRNLLSLTETMRSELGDERASSETEGGGTPRCRNGTSPTPTTPSPALYATVMARTPTR